MTTGLKRNVGAILASYKFDKTKRELYVEGRRDKSFLSWLVDGTRANGVTIHVVDDYVELPVAQGGSRARLIEFSRAVLGDNVDILCFADLDEGDVQPNDKLKFTDGRDLESYVMCLPCFRKLASLGCKLEPDALDGLLFSVLNWGRELAYLRRASSMLGLDLPFQKGGGSLDGRIVGVSNRVVTSVDVRSYASKLMQRANVKLGRLDEVMDTVAYVRQQFEKMPDFNLVHGKDVMALLRLALKDDLADPESSLWTSFDAMLVNNHETLSSVVRYLQRSP